MTQIVLADGKKVGVASDGNVALLLLAKHACRGAEVDLVDGETGQRLSWVDLPCVCGGHEGPSVVQP